MEMQFSIAQPTLSDCISVPEKSWSTYTNKQFALCKCCMYTAGVRLLHPLHKCHIVKGTNLAIIESCKNQMFSWGLVIRS